MATSTSPKRKASAHFEGMVNESSYLPASGPSAKPHTSGAVFRYSTMEIRSLLMSFATNANFQYSTAAFGSRLERGGSKPRSVLALWLRRIVLAAFAAARGTSHGKLPQSPPPQ